MSPKLGKAQTQALSPTSHTLIHELRILRKMSLKNPSPGAGVATELGCEVAKVTGSTHFFWRGHWVSVVEGESFGVGLVVVRDKVLAVKGYRVLGRTQANRA